MPEFPFDSTLNILRTINSEMDSLKQEILKTMKQELLRTTQKIVTDVECSRQSLIEACGDLMSNELENEE